jgi:hypothetical protein
MNSRKKVLKVKDWLNEQKNHQFTPIAYVGGIIIIVRRIADELTFYLGTTEDCAIEKFHEDMIHVTAKAWVDTSSGGYYGRFTVPINQLSKELAKTTFYKPITDK